MKKEGDEKEELVKNKKFVIVFIALLVVFAFLFFSSILKELFFKPTGTNLNIVNSSEKSEGNVEVVLDNLEIPWQISFLSEKEFLFTERPGRLNYYNLETGQREVIGVTGVDEIGEGGLLGVTVHPDFDENNWIYLYITEKTDEGIMNRVERYRFKDFSLLEDKEIISGIPGAPNHDGGRIVFGPDGYLYVTTGDAGISKNSQEISSLAGKLLRLDENGMPAEGNEFDLGIYTYGHRNSQGLVWDSEGRLWSTEHGRSGRASGLDEINLIVSGGNYGWPVAEGDDVSDKMEEPVIHSGYDETWAPGGIAYFKNRLFFSGLRGESLYEAIIDSSGGDISEIRVHFRREFGRLREVVLGPDGFLYISTSNRDGRGSIREGDDKIMRVDPLELIKLLE